MSSRRSFLIVVRVLPETTLLPNRWDVRDLTGCVDTARRIVYGLHLACPEFRKEVVMKLLQRIVVAFGVVASLTTSIFAAQAPAPRVTVGERFEVTSIKAVRPTLVNTIEALKKGDTAKAKEAFEA